MLWPAAGDGGPVPSRRANGQTSSGQYLKPYTGPSEPPFLELGGTEVRPAWVLPPGWEASRFNVLPGGGQLEYLLKDTVLANAYRQPEHGDRSAVWPAAYQNQASFTPYYHRLRRETHAMLETPAWRAAEAVLMTSARQRNGGGGDGLGLHTVPADQLRPAAALARDLTVPEITAVVRIASDPVILETDGVDVPPRELAHIIEVMRVLFKLRVSTPAGAQGGCPAADKEADTDKASNKRPKKNQKKNRNQVKPMHPPPTPELIPPRHILFGSVSHSTRPVTNGKKNGKKTHQV